MHDPGCTQRQSQQGGVVGVVLIPKEVANPLHSQPIYIWHTQCHEPHCCFTLSWTLVLHDRTKQKFPSCPWLVPQELVQKLTAPGAGLMPGTSAGSL